MNDRDRWEAADRIIAVQEGLADMHERANALGMELDATVDELVRERAYVSRLVELARHVITASGGLDAHDFDDALNDLEQALNEHDFDVVADTLREAQEPSYPATANPQPEVET